MDITGSEGINVYADAKSEYTRQLTQFSLSSFLKYFLSMIDVLKEQKETNKILLNFQNLLKNIPEWNHEKVQKETTILLTSINCDYFEDLLSAVFVAHTKVLSAIRLSSKQKKLQITIPKVEHFLHHTLIECARILWSNVFLFTPSGPAIERQKNQRQIEHLIQEGILQSIRSMLPVKNILKEYLKDDGSDDEDEPIKKVVEEKEKEEVEEKEKSKEEEKVEEEKVEEEKVEEEKVEEEKVEVEDKKTVLKDIEEVEDKKTVLKDIEEVEEEPIVELVEDNEETKETKEKKEQIINIDTEPTVQFADVNTVFDYDDENSVLDKPTIQILDLSGTNIEDFEDLDEGRDTPIEFESL